MAKSQWEYVREFEQETRMLPHCWIIVRIDGRKFSEFTKKNKFEKPNDMRGVDLMNAAARCVLEEVAECVLAYGQSDEYSFILRPNTTLFQRRKAKIETTIVSLFTSAYYSPDNVTVANIAFSGVFWSEHMSTSKPLSLPSFDARCFVVPTVKHLRAYLSWRQADCHINTLYNTCFWALVQQRRLTPKEANRRLQGTVSSDKHELLFSEFSINYNDLPNIFRKGSTIFKERVERGREREGEREGEREEVERKTDEREHSVIDVMERERKEESEVEREEGSKGERKKESKKESMKRKKHRIVCRVENLIDANFWLENQYLIEGFE